MHRRGRGRISVCHGIPGLSGNSNFEVMEAGARKLGYQNVRTGRTSLDYLGHRHGKRGRALTGPLPVAILCSFFVEHYAAAMIGAVKEQGRAQSGPHKLRL